MFNIYPNNYFRFENPEEIDGVKDIQELYQLETEGLPMECPYRQIMPPFFPFNGFPPNQGSGPLSPPPPQPSQSGAPTSPPPPFTPRKNGPQTYGGPSVKAVDPGAIRPCTFRFIYIWPQRGSGFWAYLTFVGNRSVSGFRWTRGQWRYFGMDLRRIESFQCF